MKKIIQTITSLVAVIAMIAIAPVASANYSINSAATDCKTVTIGNYTTGEGINGACWTNSAISAQPGQVINVAIYYHNNGTTAANNVVFKLSTPQNQTISANGSATFTGKIFVDGAEVKSETVSVNISGGPSQLILGNVMRYDRPSHANVAISNGNNILTSSGLSYGTLQPGWDNQGVIKVSFSVVGNNNPVGNQPTVETYQYDSLSNELGNVRLKGFFHSNGSNTTTWFEYRKNNGSWIITGTQNQGTGSGNLYRSLTGLATGSYEYRAVAENQYGRVDGSIKNFSINRGGSQDPCDINPDDCCDNNDCGGDDIAVTTKSAEDIDEDSAELVGDIDDIGSGDVVRWFEWDTNDDDVADGDGSRLSVSGDTNNEGEFSKRLSGLRADTRYYYRACAEDDNGDEDCGSVKSFTTDDDNNNNDDDSDLPDITTLGTIAIGSTVATVDGYYDANGCSVTTYFEYGRTSSLGSTTASFNRGNGSGSMAYSFTSLAPSTTYYYRAVGTNCEGTVRGATRSFTTNAGGFINPPVVIGGGSGNAFIQLTIDNNRDIVRSGSDVAYDVEWGNITRSTLRDLVLEINLPDQLVAVDTDMGDITRDGHAIIIEIDELGSLEQGEMTFTAITRGNLRDGDPVVAQAIMAFENPNTKVAENAIAYDSDEFSSRSTGLGASLFGLDFLPGSLAGWLLILLIILVIVVLARHFMGQNQNKVTVNTNPVPVPPAPDAGTSGNDYIVYRPTPKV